MILTLENSAVLAIGLLIMIFDICNPYARLSKSLALIPIRR